MNKNIGFIGTGQMATALATGLIGTRTLEPSKLFGFDVAPAAAQTFASKTGGTVVGSLGELVAQTEIVILAVKPQQLGDLLHQLSGLRTHGSLNPLWITIAAGVPIKTYLKELGASARLVRVMSNTPALVGCGMSAFAVSDGATTDDIELTKTRLSTIGLVAQLPERQLNAGTGLSGSGPAYVYMMIESLADGGVKMGLSRSLALQLAAQTVLGAARMVLETGEHPAVLRDRVSSPRGTTIYGTHALERNGFRAAVIDAVETAARRSNELADEH
jgi:pyrroline-5-carboxylate reductase